MDEIMAHARMLAAIGLMLASWTTAWAQTPGSAAAPAAKPASGPAAGSSPHSVVRNVSGLPNDHGQVFREYDLRPYTSRVTGVDQPQQAVVDWILRETGTEIWFSEPVGMLNANRDTLRVYHTPEMHQLVAEVVDRFVRTQAAPHVLKLSLLTVNSPAWRARAMSLLRRVPAQSPGVDAWLISKENAALLMADLRQRTDFKEHNSPTIVIQNGQSQALSKLRPRAYTRSVQLGNNPYGGFEAVQDQIQEGYRLQLSPLVSPVDNVIDAVIKCEIDQVERMVPVTIEIPTVGLQTQKAQIQVPQLVSWRLHERFRWPADHVLLLSCGVVASPSPAQTPLLGGLANFGSMRMMEPLGLSSPFAGASARADALLVIECKGRADAATNSGAAAANITTSGRY